MKDRIELDRIKRLLVRGVNWVGDTILTYPTLEALRKKFSTSKISILIPDNLVDLWITSPYIDEIIPFRKRKGLNSFFEDLKISYLLRRKRFDLAFILPRSFHSAFQVFLAGIPIRLGYENGGRSFLLTHKIPRTKEILSSHRVYYYRKLVEPFGEIPDFSAIHLRLREEDRDWAKEMLKKLGISKDRLLIGLNPGATYGWAKCWPPHRFGELSKRLSYKYDTFFLIFGKEEERRVALEILQILGREGIDLTGKTNLLQLAALLEKCRILVSNDTGTMHVATAVGTPVIALFGSTNPVTTGPWGNRHVVIKKEVPCSPCLKRTCPTDHKCMKLITVDEVLKECEKYL